MFYSADQNVLKKRIALALYQEKDLKNAACIQATCIEEMSEYRKYGLKNPVAVIPNPIDCSEFSDRQILRKPKFRFGYLGRLDKRKRVERIIYSFYKNQSYYNRAELVIIGSWDSQYENFLKSEVKRLKLDNVIFTGFITGKEKDDYISSLSALVVPSDFENFGNIVSEALVRGVPVIASKGTPWEDLERYACGFWVENDQNTINDTMLKIFLLTEEERIQMGMNGKKLIEEKYSLEINGIQLAHLYDWVLGKREKPDFVYI
jgi:glycosyltransferase involved in cell wall biosynthesis